MDGTRAVGEDARRWTARKTAWSSPIKMEYPAGLTPVHFIRLKLTRGGAAISENFYLRGTEENDYRAHPRRCPK